MNAAQIHLALNHAPLFFSFTGGILLAWSLIRKNETVKTIALFMLAAGALLTLPVFLTGEGTEEMVEHLPGVNEATIERHEDMAKLSLIVIAITGVVALAALLLRKNNTAARWGALLALLLAFGSFGTMAQTAHLGGLIRHSEMQQGTATAEQQGDQKGDQKEEEEKGEKD